MKKEEEQKTIQKLKDMHQEFISVMNGLKAEGSILVRKKLKEIDNEKMKKILDDIHNQ